MIGASILVTLGLGALGGVVLLTWTSGGQAFVVERVLRRLEGNLNGEIVISGLRSPGLHRGARLLGLRILAPDGSPLLAMDSVDAAYSIRTMLSRDIVLTDLTLWGPRLTLTKGAPGQPFNVRAFLGGQPLQESKIGLAVLHAVFPFFRCSNQIETCACHSVFIQQHPHYRFGILMLKYPAVPA